MDESRESRVAQRRVGCALVGMGLVASGASIVLSIASLIAVFTDVRLSIWEIFGPISFAAVAIFSLNCGSRLIIAGRSEEES